jgi:hypothetical protein
MGIILTILSEIPFKFNSILKRLQTKLSSSEFRIEVQIIQNLTENVNFEIRIRQNSKVKFSPKLFKKSILVKFDRHCHKTGLFFVQKTTF